MAQLSFLVRVTYRLVVALLLLAGRPAVAQHACLLRPLPLGQRTAAATLIIEAEVTASRSIDTGPHIITLHDLNVFKIFRGTLPAGSLTLSVEGGTAGLRREVVSNVPELEAGQQGLFLLEADPQQAGAFRLYAGPQGLISYDLRTRSASDPFAHYQSVADDLYPALAAELGTGFRALQPNPALEARPTRAAKPMAVTISSVSPNTLSAGTLTVLTIDGAGFGATRGNGYVGFRNADDGGNTLTLPNASEYVSWSDTQIQVRVPTRAGTGTALVANNANEQAFTPTLTIVFAVANVTGSDNRTTRVAMVSRDGAGGYTLTYNTAFGTAARGSFERALATWQNGVGANRKIAAATTSASAAASNSVNLVSFDDSAELPAGVLGVTYSYYSGCGPSSSGPFDWFLAETDYIFDGETNWQFGPALPSASQFDFESVALHEQGHGIQLGHIISPGAVMHFAIANGTANRTLSSSNDQAGGNNEIDYSIAPTTGRCGNPVYQRLGPLPVVLVAFTAQPKAAGIALRWRTAQELGSDFFALEGAEDTNPEAWTELARLPAAGSSSNPQEYRWLDTRPRQSVRYYRLRQQDLDGSVYFSNVITASGPLADQPFTFFPNPGRETVRVQLPTMAAATLRLLDLTGRAVRVQAVAATQASTTLPLDGLLPGSYVLEWRSAGHTQRQRLTKE